MTVSSRTPEGEPDHCPICGSPVTLDPFRLPSNAPCPHCGSLLLWFQVNLSEILGVPPEAITPDTPLLALANSSPFLGQLQADSLDVVEIIMEMEEEFGFTIPDSDYEKIRTVADLMVYVAKKRKDDAQ